jgi:hypothetical protein
MLDLASRKHGIATHAVAPLPRTLRKRAQPSATPHIERAPTQHCYIRLLPSKFRRDFVILGDCGL